jgi:carbon-monoxide dehydrogenase small subunit
MLAAQLEGRRIDTIEGLAADPGQEKLLAAFVRHGAVQCGYCSPGMVIAAVDLLKRNPSPPREEVRVGLSGNLCRCTGYQKIVDAVVAAAAGGS